jgi:hypothetical protein
VALELDKGTAGQTDLPAAATPILNSAAILPI